MDRPSAEILPDSGRAVHEALELIRGQRTMVLATSRDESPWTAPVYYVYHPPGFYFFSNPEARHIAQAQSSRPTAVSIFSDSDVWKNIQGLQMTGTIHAISKRAEKMQALGRFLMKFPMARSFLQDGETSHKAGRRIGDKVQLYVFRPKTILYMNNQFGFGRRVPITL